MVFSRYLTFARFCRLVCHRIPEVDAQIVREYLAEHAPPPYSWDTVNQWARKIESMMIDEGSI